ncbi:MAG: hypothetical protein ACE15C_04365 [Phycisphaerae bacterium]
MDKAAAKCAKEHEELVAATNENKRLSEQIAEQDKRILSLMALGDKRLDKLFHVKSVDLGSMTGGINTTGRQDAGDDAIKVYVLPMDQDGSIIKAAGDVKVQLFDLAAPPDDNLVGECQWPVDQIGKFWSSGFFTYHYSFICPFKVTPKHAEITVRVEFTDYLTGKHYTAQKVCKIKLPPAPETQPAE